MDAQIPNRENNTSASKTSDNESSRPSKGRFRFKSRSQKDESRHAEHRRRREERHTSSRKRHKRDNHDDHAHPGLGSGSAQTHLSPDAAFRESLFDALGDDEAADYWESVYGQPIHTYPVPHGPGGEDQGELEQMTEDEYVAYVRARMWERTREGMLEEQERLRAERAKARQREERRGKEADERRRFERAMDESIRRGRERKRKRAWGTLWDEYRRSWDGIDARVAAVRKGEEEAKPLRNLLPWPVETGKRKDVSTAAVEGFMLHAPLSGDVKAKGDEDSDAGNLLATLKAERVRWHPDKIQHRYGALGIDDVVMRSVTEVFQIIDQMWNDKRQKAG